MGHRKGLVSCEMGFDHAAHGDILPTLTVRLKVARIHKEIANGKKDFLHKLTMRLVREKQAIAIEDWAVKHRVRNPKLVLSISIAGVGRVPHRTIDLERSPQAVPLPAHRVVDCSHPASP